MTKFTQADLDKMGLQDNGDGTFSKKKTAPQPREVKYTNTMSIQRTDVVVTGSEINKKTKKPKKEKPAAEPVFFKGMNIQDIYADAEKNGYVFIKGNVPSLKNSKQLYKNSKTGKSFVTSSDLCKQYVKDTEFTWRALRPQFLKLIASKPLPYKIQFIFIRDKHKAFDYINVAQMPLDLMQLYEWLPNDDNNHVIPNFGAGYKYDPLMPGVIIRIL